MAVKDNLEQTGNRVKSAASSARDGVRDKAGGAVNRVQSAKVLGGMIELVTSFAGAFKRVATDLFNKDNASQGVNGAKSVGRGVGSIASAIGTIGDKGLRGLGNGAKRHPYIAVVSALLLGGAYFRAWRNDRAAKQQIQEGAAVPPQQPVSSPYHGGVTTEMIQQGAPGAHVARHAAQGPALPGQRPISGAGHPGQGF